LEFVEELVQKLEVQVSVEQDLPSLEEFQTLAEQLDLQSLEEELLSWEEDSNRRLHRHHHRQP
jgi:hypothetical protein